MLLGGLPPAAAMGGWGPVGLGVAFLVADGLDGWWARRRGLTSEFGAFFDKEADALFLLVLCALSAFEGHLPTWILGIGLLRYGFVVLLFLVPASKKTEARFSFARYAYGAMVGALLCSFLPYPRLYEPLVALAAGALLLSFAWSTVQVVIKAGQVRQT
jgi:phosphatidylglycerophosphate synthase